jgi:S-DNA-T family DNA segregation ATPase FtsK/SpoIIIE
MAGTSTNSRKSASGTKKKPAAKNRSNSGAKKPSGSGTKAGIQPAPIRREVGAVICAFLGVFSLIGFFNVDALFITAFSALLKGLIGWGYYVFPPALLLCAVIMGFHRGRPVAFRVVSALLLPLLLGAAAHLLFCRTHYDFSGSFAVLLKDLYVQGRAMTCGGVVCGITSMALEAMFSVYGAFPVLLAAFLIFLMVSLNLTFAKLGEWFSGHEKREYEPEPEIVPIPRVDAQTIQRFSPVSRSGLRAIDIPLDESVPDADYQEERIGFFNKRPRVRTPDEVLAEKIVPAEPIETEIEPEAEPVREVRAKKPVQRADGDAVEAEKTAVAEAIAKAQETVPAYEFPPIDLLRKGLTSVLDGREEVALNRERLETTIKSFGVAAKIVGVTRGPTVTRYDLELDGGVKLNKLTNLAGDLALSLGVTNVRIAPIPDKISTVGVEVPNKLVSIVCLRDIVESPAFRNASSSLSFAIGKDIGGDCIVGNISKLPHMLIAGTTGSGKSVCLNSLLLSLLYKSTPDEVRLIMIDPKMVELGVYNGIPHLFVPVVTDPKKAAGALQWAVVEMLKRYRLFSEAGVRDLEGYNAHQKQTGGQTLPKVVIVVDELADLMLCAAKEVEESICRVAQMGRASGMHLIIATQRPSADVITGLMKANIPSRIAFAVSSAMESRIILDAQGAEKLVGMGDMLYSPLGSGKPVRIQGAYVSDEERENVIDYIKTNATAEYSDEILAQIEKAADAESQAACGAEVPETPVSNYDELLPQAVDVIFEVKQASVSMLQRRLKLGYSRAARLVDQMEEIGIVGPFEGSKPRQILITKQQWQEMQLAQGTAPTERFMTEMEFGTDADDGENG